MGFRRTFQLRKVRPVSLACHVLGPICVELACTCKADCKAGCKAGQTLALDDAEAAQVQQAAVVVCRSLRRLGQKTELSDSSSIDEIWLPKR